MGDLSTHFSRYEFECGDGCGFAAVDVELLGILEELRDFFGARVTVTSGCRCAEHNADIGSKPTSYHIKGLAADIVIEGVPAGAVADHLEHNHAHYGIGRYTKWTHIDVRSRRARWTDR